MRSRYMKPSLSRTPLTFKPPPQRRASRFGRLFHDDKSRPRQVLNNPLGGDLHHIFVGLVDTLSALITQGKRDSLGEVMRM